MVVCNRNLLVSSDLFSGAILVSKMDVDGRMLVHPPEIPEQNDSLGMANSLAANNAYTDGITNMYPLEV